MALCLLYPRYSVVRCFISIQFSCICVSVILLCCFCYLFGFSHFIHWSKVYSWCCCLLILLLSLLYLLSWQSLPHESQATNLSIRTNLYKMKLFHVFSLRTDKHTNMHPYIYDAHRHKQTHSYINIYVMLLTMYESVLPSSVTCYCHDCQWRRLRLLVYLTFSAI